MSECGVPSVPAVKSPTIAEARCLVNTMWIITAFAVYSGQSEKPVFTPKIVQRPKWDSHPRGRLFDPFGLFTNNRCSHCKFTHGFCLRIARCFCIALHSGGGRNRTATRPNFRVLRQNNVPSTATCSRSFHLPFFLPRVLVSPSRQVLSLCHPTASFQDITYQWLALSGFFFCSLSFRFVLAIFSISHRK